MSEKSSLNKKIIQRLIWSYIFPHKFKILSALLMMTVSAAATGLHAWLVRPALDEVLINGNRDNTVLRIRSIIDKIKPSSDIWLIFAPIKQHRMSIAIQKATELGVAKIIPCITEFTNIRKINTKNLNDNAIEAAEQCGRLDVPKIENQIELDTILSNWPKDRKLIYCNERIDTNQSIIDKLSPYKNSINKWAVLIGPEGGFSNHENRLLSENNDVLSVSLGEKLLRSDTAITVSLFIIQQLLV